MMRAVENWYSLGDNGQPRSFGVTSVEILVREWTPGDGLNCAHASKQKHVPCGPPVAVQKTVKVDEYCRATPKTSVYHRVICAEHLAGQLGKSRGEARLEAETAAREKVLTDHWDEYLSEYQKQWEAQRSALLSNIPDSIKDKLLAADDGEVA